MLNITNECNMQLMARYEDKHFDLAIVDPPYGIGDKKLTQGGTWAKKYKTGDAAWDIAPNLEYFNELFRVSKNQIIWGANYFGLPATRCFLIWDKLQTFPNFSAAEYLWTSFDSPSKIFKRNNTLCEPNKIHPTQKPIKLYQWILDKYAKPNDKILDTHLGSGSIAIACHDYNFDLTACELDKEYYDKAMQRINNHINQTKLF